MASKTKKGMLRVQLPSTPCTEEMRDAVVSIAEMNNKSIAQVQREAYSFFLKTMYSITIDENSNLYSQTKGGANGN
jgi:hypothetical protein